MSSGIVMRKQAERPEVGYRMSQGNVFRHPLPALCKSISLSRHATLFDDFDTLSELLFGFVPTSGTPSVAIATRALLDLMKVYY